MGIRPVRPHGANTLRHNRGVQQARRHDHRVKLALKTYTGVTACLTRAPAAMVGGAAFNASMANPAACL